MYIFPGVSLIFLINMGIDVNYEITLNLLFVCTSCRRLLVGSTTLAIRFQMRATQPTREKDAVEMHKKVNGEFVAGCAEGKTILPTRARVVLDRSSFLYKILCGKLPSYSGNWISPRFALY